jgi:hypothetical protein
MFKFAGIAFGPRWNFSIFGASNKGGQAKNIYTKSKRLSLSCRLALVLCESANLYSRQRVIGLQTRNRKTHATYSGLWPTRILYRLSPTPPPLVDTENVHFLLWDPNIQHRTYKTPQLMPIRSQMNPFYKFPLYFKFLVRLHRFTECNVDFVPTQPISWLNHCLFELLSLSHVNAFVSAIRYLKNADYLIVDLLLGNLQWRSPKKGMPDQLFKDF